MKQLIVLLTPLLAMAFLSKNTPPKTNPPNIIYILADDLGKGLLSQVASFIKRIGYFEKP